LKKLSGTLFIFDSFGLGLFTLSGSERIKCGIHPLICIGLEQLQVVSEELSGISYSTEFR
jgi:hypothetical protein